MSSVQPYFRVATLDDALAVGRAIRPADAIELAYATDGLSPVEACATSVEGSMCSWAADLAGEVICIFGVSWQVERPRDAVIWMLATAAAERMPLAFCRWSRCALRLQADTVPWADRLYNMVHSEHTESIRFLRWLGATFGESFEVESPQGEATVYPVRV